MACYISSNNNRFYVKRESSYGLAAEIASGNRIPAVRLTAKQLSKVPDRRDKTGGRTYAGTPAGIRKETSFDLTTYLTSWTDQVTPPAYGPLFEAAMGADAKLWAGGTVVSATSTQVTFSTAHGLSVGQGVAFGGEIRFVAALPNSSSILLNAPFTVLPTAGSQFGASVTYMLSTDLPSATVFDYWDPADAVQRMLPGSAIDQMSLKLNGDYHEFRFTGRAADLIDSASFQGTLAGLTEFPVEPLVEPVGYDVIPGHIGQVWMGATPERFYTLTDAEVRLDNDLDVRANEFGSDAPQCVSAGRRTVTLDLSLYEQRNARTIGLYEAARSGSPISVMFQMGQQPGQLFGAYLKSVMPQVPEFDDSDPRLQWKFTQCRAQGTVDDEIVVAFG
jgi:hypothetical protein